MVKKISVIPQQVEMDGYEELLKDIHSLLERAKNQAYKTVDNLRVQTYWQIGERIVRAELEHKERLDYGKRVIEKLAKDLGFQKRDIYRIVQLYKAYPIVTSVMSQLTWTHYTVLITIENQEERRFYELQTIQNSWSVRELRKNIQSDLYKRTINENAPAIVTSTPPIPMGATGLI